MTVCRFISKLRIIAIKILGLIIFSSISINSHADVKELISGELYFKCDFKEKYVESLGYKFLREVEDGAYITNLFGANGAKIIIRGNQGNIIGMGKSDLSGGFSVDVKKGDFYEIELRFKQWKHNEPIMSGETQKLSYTFGKCPKNSMINGSF